MPEGNGEKIPKIGKVSANFDSYIHGLVMELDDEHDAAEIDRLNELGTFLTEVLPSISSTDSCNGLLAAAGREDLAMSEQEEMGDVGEPDEIIGRVSNFASFFAIYTDVLQPEDRLRGRPEPIPVIPAEILALKYLPKISSAEEYEALKKTGHYPAINRYNHAHTPAFVRMLVLFPSFTMDLVDKMSNLKDSSEARRFKPELFVAYQLMSRLISKDDFNSTVNQPYK